MPRGLGGNELADLLEVELLRSGEAVMSTERLRARVAENEIGAKNLPFAVRQMAWRQAVLGELYPFVLTSTGVALAPARSSHAAYQALLLMSPAVADRSNQQRQGLQAQLLERLTCQALEALLGPESRSIRFGWPSEVGRPQEFGAAITWLANLLSVKVTGGFRPPKRKDGGVDVVAWRPFADARPGFPIVLAQCTLEREFAQKARDVDVTEWATWLALDATLIVVLAVPGTLPPNEQWNEISRHAMLLDRLRLTQLVASPIDSVGVFVRDTVARYAAATPA